MCCGRMINISVAWSISMRIGKMKNVIQETAIASYSTRPIGSFRAPTEKVLLSKEFFRNNFQTKVHRNQFSTVYWCGQLGIHRDYVPLRMHLACSQSPIHENRDVAIRIRGYKRNFEFASSAEVLHMMLLVNEMIRKREISKFTNHNKQIQQKRVFIFHPFLTEIENCSALTLMLEHWHILSIAQISFDVHLPYCSASTVWLNLRKCTKWTWLGTKTIRKNTKKNNNNFGFTCAFSDMSLTNGTNYDIKRSKYM